MAIAEHAPSKLKKRNRGLLKMSHEQLHDFASTPESGMPERANRRKKMSEALAKRK